jgi:hypothetical protein
MSRWYVCGEANDDNDERIGERGARILNHKVKHEKPPFPTKGGSHEGEMEGEMDVIVRTQKQEGKM